MTATGNVTVAADSAPLINSTISNTASAQQLGIFGSKATAAGAILASNKVSGGAQASIDFTGPTQGNVSVDGDLAVEATDDAGVYSNAKITASSITTNDGGVHFFQQAVNASIESDFNTEDGSPFVQFGDRVRLCSVLLSACSGDFGSPGYTAMPFGSQEISADSTTVVRLDKRYGVARLTTQLGHPPPHVRRCRDG